MFNSVYYFIPFIHFRFTISFKRSPCSKSFICGQLITQTSVTFKDSMNFPFRFSSHFSPLRSKDVFPSPLSSNCKKKCIPESKRTSRVVLTHLLPLCIADAETTLRCSAKHSRRNFHRKWWNVIVSSHNFYLQWYRFLFCFVLFIDVCLFCWLVNFKDIMNIFINMIYYRCYHFCY